MAPRGAVAALDVSTSVNFCSSSASGLPFTYLPSNNIGRLLTAATVHPGHRRQCRFNSRVNPSQCTADVC